MNSLLDRQQFCRNLAEAPTRVQCIRVRNRERILGKFISNGWVPKGQVHAFDYQEHRAQSTREDFARTKVESGMTGRFSTLQRQDFWEPHKERTVYVDLPLPWLALREEVE